MTDQDNMANQDVVPMHSCFDIICPMHFQFNHQSKIVHVGPTLAKIAPTPLEGQTVWEAFKILRPRGVDTVGDLLNLNGRKIHMQFQDDPDTAFKGVCAQGNFYTFINLSFGIGLADAVQKFDLTNSDFAATDLAIEMLYLTEAKKMAIAESAALNKTLAAARKSALKQANSDALTGLANRRAMGERMQAMIAKGQDFACMQLDLDYFKAVNDTHGHAAGDHILQEVAAILKAETRKDDCIARVGGDEFVILFAGLTDQKLLDGIARRIIAKLERPVNYEGCICKISGSAGTTVSTQYSPPDADTLLNDADVALYASKNGGRGQHNFFNPKLLAG